MKIYLGTSGFSYAHWRGCFYPAQVPRKDWLAFYSSRFNSVELNVTFYRLPEQAVFARWHEQTPERFRFVIKGSRFITHIKKLAGCEQALAELLHRAGALKQKLAAILWQLPPSLKAHEERLESFLGLLSRTASSYSHCFEFRHPSWFTPGIHALLREYDAALCIADSPAFPRQEVLTSRSAYVRFHGGKLLYGSAYTPQELAEWAGKLQGWLPRLDTLFIFFNNDAQAFAPSNALELGKYLKST